MTYGDMTQWQMIRFCENWRSGGAGCYKCPFWDPDDPFWCVLERTPWALDKRALSREIPQRHMRHMDI